jgi:hypothetical protein
LSSLASVGPQSSANSDFPAPAGNSSRIAGLAGGRLTLAGGFGSEYPFMNGLFTAESRHGGILCWFPVAAYVA